MVDIVPKRKITEEGRLKLQLYNAKVWGRKADLTIEQWTETLKYFKYKCAYCRGKYQVFEHYIPISFGGGTTVANCVPACQACNAGKAVRKRDRMKVHFYNNKRVRNFLASRGAVIDVHVHKCKYRKTDFYNLMEIYCDCGYSYRIYGDEVDARIAVKTGRGFYGTVTVSY